MFIFSEYFDYPLEQGLRRQQSAEPLNGSVYFDYPLEQGLRPLRCRNKSSTNTVF